jgi:hypothetical protein
MFDEPVTRKPSQTERDGVGKVVGENVDDPDDDLKSLF